MSREEYESYPDSITIREIRIRVEIQGFRSREIIVHTSLLDDIEYCKQDIAALFRWRWQAELNLRSLKSVMQMDHLRCKKPHRVRNEIRAHMIAYNLIRQVMSEAAQEAYVAPWQISFKGTMSTVTDMPPVLRVINDIDLPELGVDSPKTLSRINVELQTIASFPFSVTQGAFFDALIRSVTVEIGRALKR